MKKLKLDHDVASLVLAGKVSNTWRLYDDKNLVVNDEVVLIDKVQADQPQSWKVIGVARINRIIEKRMAAITDEDYEGLRPHTSLAERLQAYRAYYGDRVTADTPVKIVYFDFVANATPKMPRIGEHVVLYADGGSRGNPGPSACGYVLLNDEHEVIVDKGQFLGITTNNQAEYQGLKFGLEEALAMGAREVDVRLDSMLVINQMKGIFKVRNRDLWPIHENLKQLVGRFERVTFTHVPREMNKLADAAANRAMDEAKSSSVRESAQAEA